MRAILGQRRKADRRTKGNEFREANVCRHEPGRSRYAWVLLECDTGAIGRVTDDPSGAGVQNPTRLESRWWIFERLLVLGRNETVFGSRIQASARLHCDHFKVSPRKLDSASVPRTLRRARVRAVQGKREQILRRSVRRHHPSAQESSMARN